MAAANNRRPDTSRHTPKHTVREREREREMNPITSHLLSPLLVLLFCYFIFLCDVAAAAEFPVLPPPGHSHSRRSTPRFLGKFARRPGGGVKLAYKYETRYFSQPLDHFSFADLPAFDQRYLVGGEAHWLRGVPPGLPGPIFFYCGNEGDIEWFAANTGFVWEIAPRFGALVVFAEHRYYGKSMPFGSRDKAYKNAESLSYLTTEQALADFATLITDLKRNMSAERSPVILFGGSYGGMLAAWMRLKYPHIAIGALASSAPILQFEDIVPPETFYDRVSSDFRRESLSCFETIKRSWDAIEDQGKELNGLVTLSRTFHLCRELNSTQELSDWLSSAYSYLAMVDYPYPSDFLMPLPGYPIKEVCRNIDGCPDGTGILDQLYAGVNIYYNYSGTVGCFGLEDDPHGMSGWDWQACTEMVMPMSSSQDSSMFLPYKFNYSAYKDQCIQDYGVKPRPQWVTTEFGGHDIVTVLKNFGSNIIFSNGLLDPWSGGSVLQNISTSIVALVTELGEEREKGEKAEQRSLGIIYFYSFSRILEEEEKERNEKGIARTSSSTSSGHPPTWRLEKRFYIPYSSIEFSC